MTNQNFVIRVFRHGFGLLTLWLQEVLITSLLKLTTVFGSFLGSVRVFWVKLGGQIFLSVGYALMYVYDKTVGNLLSSHNAIANTNPMSVCSIQS